MRTNRVNEVGFLLVMLGALLPLAGVNCSDDHTLPPQGTGGGGGDGGYVGGGGYGVGGERGVGGEPNGRRR